MSQRLFRQFGMAAVALPLAFVVGCGGSSSDDPAPKDDGNDGNITTSIYDAEDYHFLSKLEGSEEETSISYTGQTARQILIEDLKAQIGDLASLTGASEDDIRQALQDYVRGSEDSLDATGVGNLNDIEYFFSKDNVVLTPRPTYGDISENKNLAGKIAGGYINEDPDASDEDAIKGEPSRLISDFFGWSDASFEPRDDSTKPLQFLDYLIDNVVARTLVAANGGFKINIDTEDEVANIVTPYLDRQGRDYQQLIQKFVLGAVAFSQGTTDYLAGTNYRESNSFADGKTYTTAEHKWDEAFGYFGAARDFLKYDDASIRGKGTSEEFGKGYHDTNNDGEIDLTSEINLAASVNCAKRDLGSKDNTSPTDFTKEAFEAFRKGRALLNEASADAPNDLSDAQITELEGYATTAALTWEKCIAATVIHYINDLRKDMDEYSGESFASVENFENVAKHWSEMKGFALGLQFSPYSPFRANEEALKSLDDILTLMRDAPVLPGADNVDTYRNTDLITARNALRDAYGFDPENAEKW